MAKIVFVNRYFYPDHSATSQMLTDLALELSRSHAVHVITSRQRYDDPDARLASVETINGARVERVWSSRFGRQFLPARTLDYLSFYVSAFWKLLLLVRAGDTIVAKTDPPLISIPAGLVARIRRARLINWLQDLFPEVAAALGIRAIAPLTPLLRWLRNVSLRQAAVNVVLGERMAQRLRSERIPEGQIRVIHNWSDGTGIHPVPPEENNLRRSWGIADRFVVGYSGNLGRAHEFGTILDAAERLSHDNRIAFLFIGGGARRAWLESECRRRNLSNVIFKPYQLRESLAQSLSVPDVHLISLVPALEGLIVPSKFYGIAAAGRPSLYVGDPDGEIPRLLRQGSCGFTISAGDSEALAGHIARLAADIGETARLGKAARGLFMAKFDKNHAIRAWLSVLDENRLSQIGADSHH